MEILGERPAWSMNDSEKLSRLDATVAVINGLKTYYLQLVAALDASGYAKDIGAGDTARFLSHRYLIDAVEARRDLRLATALPKYEAVSDALPDPANPFPEDATPNASEAPTAADETGEGDGADGNEPTVHRRPLNLAQVAAIVSALEKVPNTVPVEDFQIAERQLVKLARTFTPRQLRDAGDRMRNILDTDGSEPEENRAYQRESLILKPADKGVKFNGYLANENAELFRTLIHAGAKPHKTIDGEPDPRARDKRQADALTTLLTTAACVIHTTDHGRATSSTADRLTTKPPGGRGSTSDSAADRGTTNSPAGDPAATNHADSTPGASAASADPTQPSEADIRVGGGPGIGEDPGTGGASDMGGDALGGGALGGDARSGGALGGDARSGGGATAGGYIPGHGPKAHLTITIDYQALKTATAQATGDAVFGDALSAAAVRRLACDAQVLPLVLGSKSQPLDVGTTKRLVTGPMRLALNARDRGCVVCGAPPIQCEAHHLVHWIEGGETCVSNLVLLCKRHHNDLHSGYWHIEIIDDVVHVTRPTWATPDPVPRGRYRPFTLDDAARASARTPGQAWTRDADGGRDTTADAAYLAIWGEDGSPTGPGTSRSPRAAGTPGTTASALAPVAADAADEPCPPDQVISADAACLDPWGDHATSVNSDRPDRETVGI